MKDREGHHPMDRAERLLVAMALGDRSAGQVLSELLEDVEVRCRSCEVALADYPRESLVARAGGTYEEALGTAAREAGARALDLARERDEGAALMQELLDEPTPVRALALAGASPRFHTWGLAAHALDLVEEALLEDPKAAGQLAEVAAGVAYSLDAGRYGEGVVADLRAVALAAGARCHVARLGSIAEAERELGRAAEHAAAGTGRERVRIELELAYAEILLAQGRWAESVAVLQGARQRGETGAEAVLVVRLARLSGETMRQAGQPKMAVAALRRGLVASGAIRGSTAQGRAAGLELIEVLCEAEWFDDAAAELADQERRLPEEGKGRLAARRHWARGRAQEGLGRMAEAQEAFREARRALIDTGDAILASRACLRELRLLLADSDPREAMLLVDQLIPLYEMRELPLWSRPFLFGLQAAAWKGNLSLDVVDAVEKALARPPGVYSRRSAREPDLVH
ncbi:MAG TPA: hypothetical protein VLF66_01960 [Thermoanaerobaculia bacterium]|nr:hypothetical protein [Thermoanaerobaculia bacterium]